MGTPPSHARLEQRNQRNPFDILQVPLDARPASISARARTLAKGLEGGTAAPSYETPLGLAQRDMRLIGLALRSLRDPNHRVVHELWARLRPAQPVVRAQTCAVDAFGWRPS